MANEPDSNEELTRKEEKAVEKERADSANAENIRNAAEVAIASKNPYAVAAGAIVKGLDKATGGKSTELLGKGMTKANKMTPGGKRMQKKSNKFAESGKSDKIGKVAALKNGKASKGKDVGAQRLQQSKASHKNDYLNRLAKRRKKEDAIEDKKKTDDINKAAKAKKKKDKQKGNNKTTSTNVDEKGKQKGRFKIVKAIAFLLIIALFAFILIIVFIFFAAIYSSVGLMIPAVLPSTYGTENFTTLNGEDTEDYKYEVEYYKKLSEISNDSDSEINTNYIHSVLIYNFYENDYSENNSDKSNVEENSELIQNEDPKIDYKKMLNMIDVVVQLMKSSSDGHIDYEKGGTFYNELKNSSKIQDYYRGVLRRKDIDTILDEVFDLASELSGYEEKDETVLTEETTVTVTETKKETSTKTETKTKTISIYEYIADSIYAATDSLRNGEVVKVYTIAYSTNLASQNNKLSIDSSNVSASNNLCSVKEGCSYDDAGNLVSGSGKQSSKNTYFYNGGYYYKKPLESAEITNLNNAINSVFGSVLVNSDGAYPNLDINKINGLGDNYKTILNNSYGNLSIKNIGEDSYILDGSYGTEKVLTKVTFYDQNDYGAYNFCGKKKETIKTSGCGTTSMAIIVSTYENSFKYDPVTMMNEARKTGYCGGGISGTSPGFFKKEANIMKYKYYKASKYSKKDLNLILKHLSQGHLVIAHMSPGHFTSGGHYMVLGGVDPETKKVYVYDPYNKVNKSYRKTGNGWYSFNNIIVKEAWGFYIIWKG